MRRTIKQFAAVTVASLLAACSNAVTVGLALVFTVGIPVAHADTFPGDHDVDAFNRETGMDDGGTPTGEELAEHICQFLELGHTAKEAIDGGVISSGAQRINVMFVVFDSEYHFCPDMLHRP